ncbi:Hypothetical predicted protein [Octopus vulgaris]|uniref:Uncharacterized protein n=1 Tax=Octopus vulgaris TaxID=6645 RepID=A0AA36FBW9_OCTVU|nr:Hypothetical predicted protein [Octopus vulgaris]
MAHICLFSVQKVEKRIETFPKWNSPVPHSLRSSISSLHHFSSPFSCLLLAHSSFTFNLLKTSKLQWH